MRKKISLLFCSVLILTSTFAELIPAKVEASTQNKKVEIYQGVSNIEMPYENPKILPFPQPKVGNYPETIKYDQDGYTGLLEAKRIRLVPKNKIDKSYPVYKTVSKTFNRTLTDTFANKNDANFPDLVQINEDGYKGSISRTNISWKENWVRNRNVELTRSYTSGYHEFAKDAGIPNRYTGNYKDEITGRNISFSLPKDGKETPIRSRTRTITYRSEGRAQNYDVIENYYLGFMSDNPTTYFAGRFDDPKPSTPIRYYGIPRDIVDLDWKMIDYGWDESRPQNADNWPSVAVYRNGSYWWRSTSGNFNKWRKGVWIDYELKIREYQFKQDYKGKVNLPDYIKDYTGTASFEGTLSKEVLDYIQEKFVANEWDVYVEYEGEIKGANLTADDILIIDPENGQVNPEVLYEGRDYIIEFSYHNSGSRHVGAHSASIYYDDKELKSFSVDGLDVGKNKIFTSSYTPDKTGQIVLKGVADSKNEIEETDKNDNVVTRDVPVIQAPKIELSYSPEDIYEGDTVTVHAKPMADKSETLSLIIEKKVGNNDWETVLEVDEAKDGEVHDVEEIAVIVENYEYRATVRNTYGLVARASINFLPKELKIIGRVDHTDRWKEIHKELENNPNQFYSGEKFLLHAELTNHSPKNVTVEMEGVQLNKERINVVETLDRDGESFTGELYRDSFSNQYTKLTGSPMFIFKGEWENGVVKTDVVTVEMIDDVLGVFDLYQSN